MTGFAGFQPIFRYRKIDGRFKYLRSTYYFEQKYKVVKYNICMKNRQNRVNRFQKMAAVLSLAFYVQ